ncbi:pyruvate dehydrogenase (acetyl-transferring) E1 component subunit alpha [Niastella koreensis]|uniref:Pyruvate dehydrogenase E1 component subunit alpha n=2 Tax=Niastella koreensis TaxID=354356 RepID=G8TJA1_NIAKG|nr:pyruvate dehydrogenase (acetyl-transferring) E1 component subunit alpha [Niastella koreensis]AEV98634.1 pyruvate dehydrogenase (acetyl-transferring) E1 component, alpha subunit [Niastella koreensis GR20-10]OQP53316.1 pyruvate dehydrogenase (acetyl-transferring) E1 component subunit alpha [Niastella koreensis]
MPNEISIQDLPAVDREHGIQLLSQMMRIRRFEEKAAEMYTKTRIRGFLHLYIGEEAVATGVIQCLSAEDTILSTYREHGHALARGIDASLLMAEMYGKVQGCCRGRGGSMHLFDINKKFYGGNAIVAGHLPIAVGMALAAKKQNKKNITCCFFGDGAVAEGAFHESMNLAALWGVPLLMVCENNLYAMGTAIRYSHAIQELEKKGAAYGIEAVAVNGMDVLAVEAAARLAVVKIQKTGRPYFLVCNTYRFRAHSMFDADLYRDKSEVEAWKQKDPIPALQTQLLEQRLVSEEELQKIKNDIEQEMQAAVAFAEGSALEPVEELTKFVYSNKG